MKKKNHFNFEGSAVLITGGGNGLGLEAAKQFKNAGAQVFVADRNIVNLKKLKLEKHIDGFFCGDLLNQVFIDEIVKKLSSKIDILINNVGAGFSKTLEETSIDDFNYLMNLNFMVAVKLCQGFMPKMAKRGNGKVINVSTILADNPLPTLAAYAASKAALIAFTKAVALQYAPSGVQANVIAPGYIENPKHQEYFLSSTGKEFAQRFMPTGRTGHRDSINGSYLFLASNLSDHITGQVLKVDGGYSIW
jgi:NAD(P)-dependent dehydrogenase (short-subunit alcohol dehydrogenase family)